MTVCLADWDWTCLSFEVVHFAVAQNEVASVQIAGSPDPTEWPETAFEEASSCLFCSGTAFSPAVADVADEFFDCVQFLSAFVRCNDCQSLVLKRRLTADYLPRAYARYYTHEDGSGSLGANGLKGRLRAAYIDHRFGGSRSPAKLLGAALYRLVGGNVAETDAAFRYVPPAPARILDYGCGGGTFLTRLASSGYDVTGVDFDPVSVAKVREAGIPAFDPAEADEQDWQGNFDAITLGHVIEHVYDPRALLGRLRDWLADDGMLYIEVPNAQATGLDIFGRFWRGLEAPRHLAIPSLEGLRLALANAGFAIDQVNLRHPVRAWMWAESLQASPEQEREALRKAMAAAPALTEVNAEFLTIVARPVQS